MGWSLARRVSCKCHLTNTDGLTVSIQTKQKVGKFCCLWSHKQMLKENGVVVHKHGGLIILVKNNITVLRFQVLMALGTHAVWWSPVMEAYPCRGSPDYTAQHCKIHSPSVETCGHRIIFVFVQTLGQQITLMCLALLSFRSEKNILIPSKVGFFSPFYCEWKWPAAAREKVRSVCVLSTDGCKTWSDREHGFPSRLRVFHNGQRRRKFGPVREGVTRGWRKLGDETVLCGLRRLRAS